jgi:hypothetical protein
MVYVISGSRSLAHNLNDLRERWSLRREEPIKYEVPVKVFKQDIANMSKDDLVRLLADITTLKAKVKSTLERMKIKYSRGREDHTDDEYLDASGTDRSIGAHIQAINAVLAVRRNDYKESLIKHFFDVCREKLSKEDFALVMDEANERARK